MGKTDEAQTERMEAFLAAENWNEDERLIAAHRAVATGDMDLLPDPLATEFLGALMVMARAHNDALIALANQIDELKDGK